MFEFTAAFFTKVVSILVFNITTAIVAVGLMSAPVLLPEEPVLDESTDVAVEEVEEQDLPVVAEEPKAEPKVKAQVVDVVTPPAPAPVVVPEPVVVPDPVVTPPAPEEPETFVLPSGIVVDKFGNPVGSQPVAAPAVPVPAPTTQSLPEGWHQLPSGLYVSPDGNIVDMPPDAIITAPAPSNSLPAGWYQLPSGLYMDEHGFTHETVPQVAPQQAPLGYQTLPAGWTQLQSGIYKGPNGELLWTIPDSAW